MKFGRNLAALAFGTSLALLPVSTSSTPEKGDSLDSRTKVVEIDRSSSNQSVNECYKPKMILAVNEEDSSYECYVFPISFEKAARAKHLFEEDQARALNMMDTYSILRKQAKACGDSTEAKRLFAEGDSVRTAFFNKYWFMYPKDSTNRQR